MSRTADCVIQNRNLRSVPAFLNQKLTESTGALPICFFSSILKLF